MIALSVPAEWVLWGALLAAAGAMSYCYSSLETAIYLMNKVRLDLLSESGLRAARWIRAVIADRTNFLAVLLIGNTFMQYAATFAVSAMFVLAGQKQHAELYTLLAATPLLFILCESLPKNIAQRVPEPTAYRLAGVLKVSSAVFNACGIAPLVRGFARLLMRALGRQGEHYVPMGHESVTAVMAESHASGVLTHLQTVMADRIMHISDVTVRHAMIPMDRVVSAPSHLDREKMIELMRAHDYSRYPEIDAAGHVTAIVDIYDAVAGQGVRARIPEPVVLPEATTITDALFVMQRTHSPMAIVTDDAGKHIGIVTVKDLVEEIVGEIGAW